MGEKIRFAKDFLRAAANSGLFSNQAPVEVIEKELRRRGYEVNPTVILPLLDRMAAAGFIHEIDGKPRLTERGKLAINS
ncbi:MAG: hypothetical protein CEN90_548 [Parcubacteria group bacterium Licking1014_17]|nr:MAG: hypothetical protein CEN90_548 [Parcubacteria group bacterium Licking1014_17]